jgi:hypothetical protein
MSNWQGLEMRRFSPGMTALIPEGWVIRESIEFASPAERAYVIASAYIPPADTTSAQLAEAQGNFLRERLPEYDEVSLVETSLPHGGAGLVRSFRWTPPEGERLAELQLYAVANGRAIVLTARSPAEGFDEREPKLRELLLGIGFGGQGSAGGIFRRHDTPVSRTYAAYEGGDLATTAAQAFGLEATQDETSSEQVTATWKCARSTWQQAGEEL